MTAEGPPETIIRYPRHMFAYVTVVCGALALGAMYLSLTALEAFATDFWLVVAVAIALFAALFSLPCMFTRHTADERGLRIRMGLLINAFIPYDSMLSVAPMKVEWGLLRNRLGIGVMHKQKTNTVFVLSSFQGAIRITLRHEVRLGLTRTPARHLVLNTDAPDLALDLMDVMIAKEEA